MKRLISRNPVPGEPSEVTLSLFEERCRLPATPRDLFLAVFCLQPGQSLSSIEFMLRASVADLPTRLAVIELFDLVNWHEAIMAIAGVTSGQIEVPALAGLLFSSSLEQVPRALEKARKTPKAQEYAYKCVLDALETCSEADVKARRRAIERLAHLSAVLLKQRRVMWDETQRRYLPRIVEVDLDYLLSKGAAEFYWERFPEVLAWWASLVTNGAEVRPVPGDRSQSSIKHWAEGVRSVAGTASARIDISWSGSRITGDLVLALNSEDGRNLVNLVVKQNSLVVVWDTGTGLASDALRMEEILAYA